MFSSMKRMTSVVMILTLLSLVNADLIAGALCSAGCAALVCACYGAAGATFGTITAGVGTPTDCNKAFGTCMGNCAAATVVPVP